MRIRIGKRGKFLEGEGGYEEKPISEKAVISGRCRGALTGLESHIESLKDRYKAYEEMLREGKEETTIRGFEYTKDELEDRIQENIYGIIQNAERFKECIETGYLPPYIEWIYRYSYRRYV